MEQIDLKTLVYVASAVTFCMGFLLIMLMFNSGFKKGLVYWVLGSFSLAMGSLVYGLTMYSDSYVELVIAGSFFILGQSLYLGGFYHFQGEKVRYCFVFGIPAFQIIQGSFFYLVYFKPEIRSFLFTLLEILNFSIIIYQLLKFKSNQYFFVTRVLVVSFIILIVAFLLRLFYIIETPVITATGLVEANKLNFIVVNIVQFITIYSFFALVHMRVSNELKTQIALRNKLNGVIAHDLRSPLTSIFTYLDLLKNDVTITAEDKSLILEKLEKVNSSTMLLIQNLFDWSAQSLASDNLKTESVDINHILRKSTSLFSPMAEQKGIQLHFSNSSDRIDICGNPIMLESIFRNFISNSIKFTHPEGKITIESSVHQNRAKVCIKDTGVGMNEQLLEKVNQFDGSHVTFGTHGEKGSGLGLLICKEFIKANKGEVAIKSEPNKGTEIEVSFPI